MSHTDLLQTVAALAMTLLGFTGIVVTAGPLARGERGWRERVAFYAMLAPTLTALWCSFVPDLLSMLLESELTVWRMSNGILGAFQLINLSPVVFRLRKARYTVLITLGVIAIIAHFLAAFGVFPAARAVFILGLLWQLFVGVFFFLQLIRAGQEHGWNWWARLDSVTPDETPPSGE